MLYAPDMHRNIFEPEVILTNIARDRGEPVCDELPERVKQVLSRLDLEAPPSGTAPRTRFSDLWEGRLSRLLGRFLG